MITATLIFSRQDRLSHRFFFIEPEIKEKNNEQSTLKNRTKPWFYHSKERGFWLPAVLKRVSSS